MNTQQSPGIPAFHILLALSTQERHGYDIMRQVEHDSEGAIHMGPATLYSTLKRLLEQGLIEELGERPDPSLDDQRRRYYRLTQAGATVLEQEVVRMERAVQTFRRKLA